ncbi:histidine kinase, partial [Lysobacter sp. 2RAB21]
SWWATWWARLIWLSALVAVGVVLYRLRVRQLLRLERQRNEIAMDLHDEMGSGLGSISVLANVAAREGYDEGERRQIAGEIASVAELLGGGLRSLVWTMRESRAGLADLAAQLAQHAGRLLPGPAPELRMRWPEEFPPGTVRPQVRRHVLMIALEALHNAARHAHAAQVVVELSAQAAGWRLRIDDD